MNAPLKNFRRKPRAESVPPETDRFVAHIDPAFVLQILYIPERQWNTDIHHHGEADNLAQRIEVAKWIGFGHHQTLFVRPSRFKLVSSESTSDSTAQDE